LRASASALPRGGTSALPASFLSAWRVVGLPGRGFSGACRVIRGLSASCRVLSRRGIVSPRHHRLPRYGGHGRDVGKRAQLRDALPIEAIDAVHAVLAGGAPAKPDALRIPHQQPLGLIELRACGGIQISELAVELREGVIAADRGFVRRAVRRAIEARLLAERRSGEAEDCKRDRRRKRTESRRRAPRGGEMILDRMAQRKIPTEMCATNNRTLCGIRLCVNNAAGITLRHLESAIQDGGARPCRFDRMRRNKCAVGARRIYNSRGRPITPPSPPPSPPSPAASPAAAAPRR
jgi:hypothetical protein